MNINFVDEMDVVDDAYSLLAKRLGAALEAAEAVVEAKALVDDGRMALLTAGVEGKNEAQREAAMRASLSVEYGILAAAEERARWTRHQADVAQLEVDRVRLRVRLMELAAGMERPAA